MSKFFVLAAVFALAACGGGASDAPVKPTAQQLVDAKYLDDKYDSKAVVACGSGADDYLRSIAKFDFDWDDEAKGVMGIKFGRYLSHTPSPGVLVMVSNRAKLQNGFGAFQHINLYCRYDTQQDKVIDYGSDDPS